MPFPAIHFDCAAHYFCTKSQLHEQPVWCHTTVGVSKCDPTCLSLQKKPGTCIACCAYIFRIDDHGLTRPLRNDGCCAITAIVQHYYDDDGLPFKAMVMSCGKNTS